MTKAINTLNPQTGSTIIAAEARKSEIYTNAERDNAELTPDEEAEIAALDRAMFVTTPSTKAEAVALYKLSLDHLELAAEGVPLRDAATLHRAFAAALPLLCAA